VKVGTRLGQRASLRRHVAVDAHRRRDPQPALRVHCGRVDARTNRARTGQHAGQASVGVGHHRHANGVVLQQVEHLAWIGPDRRRDEVENGHVPYPREAIHPRAGLLGDHPDRAVLEDDHGRAVCALVDQCHRIRDRVVWRKDHRGVDHQIATLDEVDRLLHRCDRKILRQNDDAAAPGDRLGHPPTRHRRHVGDHHGDGGARAVDRRQADVEARRDVGSPGNDEDVVVRQVVRRGVIVEELHA
jgi:hypothetical protein